jgi:Flp pilus assembly protein TadG
MSSKRFFSRFTKRTKWRGIKGLCYNEQGISAIEFAFIAPVLVLVYFGCIEISFLMRIDRRVTSTSASLGDLTARLAVATDDDMAEMFQAARVMMQPYDATNAHLRITSIVDKGDGVAKVAWSDGYKMNAYAKGATVTVPAGIIPSPGSAIMSEVEYTYTSPFTFVLGTDTVVKDKFYLRPRRVNEINRVHDSDDDGTSFGPSS